MKMRSGGETTTTKKSEAYLHSHRKQEEQKPDFRKEGEVGDAVASAAKSENGSVRQERGKTHLAFGKICSVNPGILPNAVGPNKIPISHPPVSISSQEKKEKTNRPKSRKRL